MYTPPVSPRAAIVSTPTEGTENRPASPARRSSESALSSRSSSLTSTHTPARRVPPTTTAPITGTSSRERPAFGEALAARFQGGAIPTTASAASDFICSLVAAAATTTSIGGAAAQSGLSSALKLSVEAATYVGMTAFSRTSAHRSAMDRFSSADTTNEQALQRIREVAFYLASGNGVVAHVGYSAISSAILSEPVTPKDIVTGVISAFVSTGIISASIYGMYRSSPEFRAQVDDKLNAIKDLLASRADFRQGQLDNAMERGESVGLDQLARSSTDRSDPV